MRGAYLHHVVPKVQQRRLVDLGHLLLAIHYHFDLEGHGGIDGHEDESERLGGLW